MNANTSSADYGMSNMVRPEADARHGAGAACGRRRYGKRAGMTLIEIVISIGILSLVLTAVVGALMQNVRRNRQLSMIVTGMQTINEVVGEIEDLTDSTKSGETYAHAIVDYFTKKTSETIDIGPNRTTLDRAEIDNTEGCLVYRFWVPTPGSPNYPETDSRFQPNHKAIGEMKIYLDEDILNTGILPLPGYSWTDLTHAAVPASDGLDLNLNGKFDDNLLNNYAKVKQLVIIFTVTFYSDEKHNSVVASTTRDILVTRIKDATKDVDPTT